jgi:ribosomal protein S18 acetylase RimI-like enzyme/ketosteroid isomerase-like protein
LTRASGPVAGSVIERYVQAWKSGDLPGMVSCYHDDFTLHYGGSNALSGTHRGKAASLRILAEFSHRTHRQLVSVDQIHMWGDTAALVVRERLGKGRSAFEALRTLTYRLQDGFLAGCTVLDGDIDRVDRLVGKTPLPDVENKPSLSSEADTTAPLVAPIDVEQLSELRALWLQLHHHHQAVEPSLAPYVSDRQSWQRRREMYEDALALRDSFGLVVRQGKMPTAYAMVRVEEATAAWNDTWAVGKRTAEILTLVVAEGERGRGVGSALMRQVQSQLNRIAIRDVLIGAVPNNQAAIGLYKKLGYRPTWLYLSRFGGDGAELV